MPQIRLLGGVGASRDDGAPIDVGPPKCQAVLAALALSPGSPVPVPRLVALVWGEDPPRTAEKTLQSYVAQLRKGLGHDVIERTGAAYRLAVADAAVDVGRFQRHLAAGDVEAALGEWNGPPLAGLEVPGLVGVIDGLVEQWLGAIEAALGDVVDRDPGAAVAELTELTSRHPFREGVWALLMTALYRTGRQAEALAAYQRARAHLVDELGVEPGPRLRELEARILGQDGRLDIAPAASGGPLAPTGTVTLAFSDIEGSSRLWAAHREAMSAAVARHDEIVRSVAAANDGFVFSTGGDSFGVAFRRASDALDWADDVQRAMAAEPWPEHAHLRVRIGVHTGDPEQRGDDYFGPAVNLAAQVAAAGHGGQTLLSAATASLLEGRELVHLGAFGVDAARSPVRILQVGDARHPPLRVKARRGNLPRRTGRLIGRDDSLSTVAAALAARPVVTLVGPGGIGKTTLAVAAGRMAEADAESAAWLVELADIVSPADVARTVADVLGVTGKPGETITESIVAHLEPQAALVVLDNCEHVAEAAAEVAGAVARGCPGVSVLATSRERLGLPDEQVVVVGPLEPGGAAAELFEERARSVDPAFDLTAERNAVEELCARLDGLPLAIELAAARVRALSPNDLLARLDHRLGLLDGGRRRGAERHRTLRATIEWSYDLLSASEQAVWQRLSVFAGSFDLRAAEVLGGGDDLPADHVGRLLENLIERSMVTVEPGAYGRRFRLLETMRQFAAEHLAEAGESERTSARHAEFVRAEIAGVGRLLTSNDEIEGATRLGELWPNLRAAVDWALSTRDVDLARSLLAPVALELFVRRGYGEIADWIERLLDIIPEDDQEAIAYALLWAAMHYSMTQQSERYRELIEARGSPDHLFVRYAYLVGVEDHDFGALELGPRMVAEMRRRGEEAFARLFEIFIGGGLMNAGRLDDARSHLEGLAERLRAEGPPSFLNWALYLLGAIATFRDDHQVADRYWDEVSAVEVPPRTNSPNEVLSARAAFRQGRGYDAYRILHDYIDELTEADNMAGVEMVAIEFATMMTTLDRVGDAAVILGHLDAVGMLAADGAGFSVLLADVVARVAGDPGAAAARQRAAADGLDERAALAFMRQVFAELLAVR